MWIALLASGFFGHHFLDLGADIVPRVCVIKFDDSNGKLKLDLCALNKTFKFTVSDYSVIEPDSTRYKHGERTIHV